MLWRWISIMILLPSCLQIVVKLYLTFVDSSVSFTVDTLSLNWNTTFPAVTICEVLNGEKMWDTSERLFGADRDHRYDEMLTEATFFKGKCHSCSFCEENNCTVTPQSLQNSYRAQCNDLIKNCSWISAQFECCKEFLPLNTEYGTCYTFNSIQTKYPHRTYINNRETGAGVLEFELSEDVQIHVHPPNEIPFHLSEGTIKETVLWGSEKEIVFSLTEIINEAGVENISPELRKCRLTSENSDGVIYSKYSFSACVVECAVKASVELCKCVYHPLLPKNIRKMQYKPCDFNGLQCLSDRYQYIIALLKDCGCVSSCEEPEYNLLYSSAEKINKDEVTSVIISMAGLPNQRYVRRVVRNDLDIIISAGGIVGLFYGASFLSVIEVACWFHGNVKSLLKMFQKIHKKILEYKKIKSMS